MKHHVRRGGSITLAAAFVRAAEVAIIQASGVSMATYIPWYGKKRVALAECERNFLDALRTGASAAALVDWADQIRAAQVRALRAKRAQLKPAGGNATAMAHLDQEIAYWLGLSALAIIDGYRNEKLCGHRSSAVRQAAHGQPREHPRI